MSDYTDAHRLFLQIITAKRILPASEVKSTYERCSATFGVKEIDLKDFVMAINQQIGPLSLNIRRYYQEDVTNDIQCYILVNTLNSAATRHASPFIQREFSLLKKIIDEIVNQPDGSINEMDAVNLAPHLEPKMKISDAEAAIDRFVKNKWLLRYEEEPDDIKLSLSGLAMAELQSYLEETYNDENLKCPLCKFITFKGYICSSCNLKFHRLCATKYWVQSKSSPMCPAKNCSAKWPKVKLNSPNKRRRT